MCLAIPGRVLSIETRDGSRVSQVAFGGITREVVLDFVPEAQVDQWVLVHVGFALSVVDDEEAARSLALLRDVESAADEPSSDGAGVDAPASDGARDHVGGHSATDDDAGTPGSGDGA
jgi:hydrogenase expression/formation protein HypC